MKRHWDFNRDDAGNRGTYMHAVLEWLLTDPRTMLFVGEIRMFLNFYENHLANVTPYRLEWRLFDEDLDLAGNNFFETNKVTKVLLTTFFDVFCL